MEDRRSNLQNIRIELQGPRIVKDEFKKAIQQAKNRKAVWPDEVNTEIIKLMDIDENDVVLMLFNE